MLSFSSMRRARLATAIALALALAASAWGTATVSLPSTISIVGHGLHFRGKVGSTNAACLPGRKVVLFRDTGLKLGSVKANAAGKWKITVSGSAGITMGSFAKVKKRSEGTAGMIYVCEAAHSATVAYSP
jgi:hypothetical protein